MMDTLWLDTETYCEKPLKWGTYQYAEACEIDIITYARNDGPVIRLDIAAGDDYYDFLCQAHEAEIVVSHNAMFDRNVLRLGNLKINIPLAKWRCSMVRAMAHGLPGALEKVGDILRIPQDKKKLKEGHEMMMLFCKPRPKNSKIRRATGATHPAERAKYLEYADHDVEACRAISKKLPEWNYSFDIDAPTAGAKELRLWLLDQEINDRGYLIDQDLVNGALRAIDLEQARLKSRTRKLSGYTEEMGTGLASTTQRDAMLEYVLNYYGLLLPDLRSATVERYLASNNEIPDILRELLIIRLQASSTSTSKYKALQRGVMTSGRMCGTIQFDGAIRTRRAAGRVFQPQNLPSRGLLPQKEIDLGVAALKAGTEEMFFDNVMLLTSSAIRGAIIAKPGHKLAVSDLSNIEGRGLVWLSGEDWKLDAFREYDAVLGADGTWYAGDTYRDLILSGEHVPLELDEKGESIHRGPDLYKLAYAKSFGISPKDVDKFGRSIGKVQELALGYAGGVSAFVTFAMAYNIDLEVMADTAWDALPDDTVREAGEFLDWRAKQGTTFPMSRKAATTCEVFKRLWRAAHPATVAMWADLEEGFRDATAEPGTTFTRGVFKFRRDGFWLRIQLPSGRVLCYPAPRVDDKGNGSFMGVNQYTRAWERIETYSGKLAENATQSFSRDILYDAQPRITEAGYPILFTVHDEAVTEPPDRPGYSSEMLSALLSTPPAYALDMPLAAAGFEDSRYRKD